MKKIQSGCVLSFLYSIFYDIFTTLLASMALALINILFQLDCMYISFDLTHFKMHFNIRQKTASVLIDRIAVTFIAICSNSRERFRLKYQVIPQ